MHVGGVSLFVALLRQTQQQMLRVLRQTQQVASIELARCVDPSRGEVPGDWGQCHPTSKEHLWLQMHCLRKNKSTILAFPHGCSD